MDVQLTGYDISKSDFDCRDGEVETAIGYVNRHDGCLISGFSVKTAYTLPEGFTQLTRHMVPDGENIIAVSIQDGYSTLWWATYDADKTDYVRNEFTEIITTEEILCHTTASNDIIIGTSQGIVSARWDGVAYVVTCSTLSIDIEFGLRKAGALITGDTIEVAADLAQSANAGGSGASRPHPTDNATIQNREKVSQSVARIYNEAVTTHVTNRGYVNQPILVRYALRTSTGKHIWPSAPILMLPTVLPPRIGMSTIIANDATGKAYIRPELTDCSYHELCYRMPRQGICLSDDIVAVDIYASKPFATYDTARLSEGYVTNYADVTATASTSHPRGRRQPTTSQQLFEGRYAVSENIFADQYIDADDMNGDVWMMYANNRLIEQICNASRFFLIASIPSAEIVESDTFVTIPVYYGDEDAVDLDNVCLCQSQMVANALCRTNGQIAAAVRAIVLPQPNSPRNAYCGNAELTTLARMTVSVTINDRGRRFRLSASMPGYTGSLYHSLPRYLYYPDRRAEQMTITQGNESVTVSLAPHPAMEGAYWMGGLGYDIDGLLLEEEDQCTAIDDRIDTSGMIVMSQKDDCSLYAMDSALTLSCDSITALGLASRTDLYSTIGRYPMYAFTTNGVWILEHSSATGKLLSAQLLTSHPCRHPLAMTAMDDAFAYVSDDGIYAVSQHSVTRIMTPWTRRTFDIGNLPHIAEVLGQCNVPAECIGTVVEHIGSCRILYDSDRRMLIAYIPRTNICYAYSTGARMWTVVAMPIGHAHKTDSGILQICNDNAVGVLCDEPAGYDGLIVTRPIKAGREIGPHNLAMAEVLGCADDDNVWLMLYGSNDMTHWHLIQSARRKWLEDLDRTTYRYHRFVIVSRLGVGEYIYGISCRQA